MTEVHLAMAITEALDKENAKLIKERDAAVNALDKVRTKIAWALEDKPYRDGEYWRGIRDFCKELAQALGEGGR